MNIQDFHAKIIASSLSAEKKEKINTLLDGKVTVDVLEQIKDLIQEDIDIETDEMLTIEDAAEISTANNQLDTDLSQIESQLKDDMEYVEKEMGDIEKMVQELDKVIDQEKIDSIRASI